MAATVDATNGIIHCWIRNATTNTLNYPCSDFGDNGFVTFDIKSETNWISLIPWVFPSANEARPEPPYRTKTVKPGQVISYTEDLLDSPERVLDGRNTLMLDAINAAFLEGPNRVWYTNMVQAINTRWMLLTNLCYRDTFALDFVIKNPFVIEGITNRAVVTARVTQKFRLNGGRKIIILTSPEFECPVFKYDSSLLESSRYAHFKR